VALKHRLADASYWFYDRARHKTAFESAVEPGTGMGLGRGETTGNASPSTGGVTRESGAGREIHPRVFVLAKDGTPLDPCHPARARKLLARRRAVVVRHTPFVIRLKERGAEGSKVQGVEIGIDPGSRHTGVAVFRTGQDGARHGLYSMQIDQRGFT
jgi:hypothetical protein